MLKRMFLLGLTVVLVSGGAAYANFVDGFESYQNPGPGNGYELSVLSGGVWTAKNVSAGLSDPDYSEPAHTGVMARSNRGTGHRGDERPITAATTYTDGVVSVESWQMLSDLNAAAGELYCGTGFAHDDGYNKSLTANLAGDPTGSSSNVILEWRDNSFAGSGYDSVSLTTYSWDQWVGVRTSLDLDNNTISRSYSLDDGANWLTGPNDGESITPGISVSQVRIQGGSKVYAYIDDINASWVPEPATLSVLFLGGLAALLRRRR